MPKAGAPFDYSLEANLPDDESSHDLSRQILESIIEAHPDITTVKEATEHRITKEVELNNNPGDRILAEVLELIALEEYLDYTQPKLEKHDVFEKAAHGGNALSLARASSYADMGALFAKKSFDEDATNLFKLALQRVKSDVQSPTPAFINYVEPSIQALE